MQRRLDEWLTDIETRHPRAIDLGLDRMRAVALRMAMGKPARLVITVAGTNGKGSTVAFIEAIARAAGWRVGAYTSPHLLAYNERVRIDGQDVDDAALVEAFEAVEASRVEGSVEGDVFHRAPNLDLQQPDGPPPRGAISLTYFETGTLAALWLFERADLDLAILEVGLGGRLDAVNLIDPDVTVITTVDLDHQDWLGNDREAIGAEKVGIARAWTPLVIGEDDPPASVLTRAYAIGAATWRANSDFFFEPIDTGCWCWREVGCAFELPMPSLSGPSQLRNAATAIAALRALADPAELPSITAEAIAKGVARTRLAGRLQRFDLDQVDIIVDVAHNPQAARELAAWLRHNPSHGRTLAVFAALADKDVAGVVAALAEQVDTWHVAGLADAGARGADIETFSARLIDTAAASAERHASIVDALATARSAAAPGDRIVVFGSFHTAAAALRALGT